MKNQTEYKVVEAFSLWGINRKVNKLIADGWEPQGGVCRLFTISQALVRYPTTEKCSKNQ